MQWNDHSRIEGRHATFSASKYNWLNYTDDKLVTVYDSLFACRTETTERTARKDHKDCRTSSALRYALKPLCDTILFM